MVDSARRVRAVAALYPGSLEMPGMRLIRKAPSCTAAKSAMVATAGQPRSLGVRRAAAAMPAADAAPTNRVIAISAGENVPVTRRAQPSRNSQIADMMNSQTAKQGIAAQPAAGDLRSASAMTTQSGAV